ncbi:protein of unknown function [uncultured Sphingopyxis sp.]|uniref:Uncharacterized protein n=1 Tax=uncultured Sphingopyxis sp. TaxID=310581 RepID=A0A1Y5PVK0_9SPHN|nr:protein of unknown function [uncultured Sphingopyxis sp.]
MLAKGQMRFDVQGIMMHGAIPLTPKAWTLCDRRASFARAKAATHLLWREAYPFARCLAINLSQLSIARHLLCQYSYDAEIKLYFSRKC